MFLEEFLAQANGLGGNFHQFVVVNEFQRLLQGHTNRRCKNNILIGTCRTNISQLFRF